MNKYEKLELEMQQLEEANLLMDKAESARTKKDAIKYAKEAYKTSNKCFDAVLFLSKIESNTLKRKKILDDGLAIEKERLTKEGFFEDDNIGSFYGFFETRPYIRGLYFQAYYYLEEGKISLAKDVCKEILRLNESDNTGSRYFLSAIYAYLEDEKSLLKLYKKYPEQNLSMLVPLFVLYYKLGDDAKAKKYLNKANDVNPNLFKYYKATIKDDKIASYGCYAIGEPSEVFNFMENVSFLMDTIPYIGDFIFENIKISKRV